MTTIYTRQRTLDPSKYLSQKSANLVRIAFAHDGFIAGGFAHVVTKYMQMSELDVELQVNHYLGNRPLNPNPIQNADRGDIDLFFPSEDALDGFMKEVKSAESQGYVHTNQNYPGFFTEVFVEDKHRFQIIHFTNNLIDTLNGFDIYNGMVALDAVSDVVPTGWHELIRAEMLHVHRWDTSPQIIKRLSKWVRKHRYAKLTPKTASEIGDAAMQCIKILKEKPWKPQWADLSAVKGNPLTADNVVFTLRQFLPQMTNDQLLLLTTVYPMDERDKYGQHAEPRNPFSILRERAKI